MVVSSSPTLSLKDIGSKTRQAALKLSVLSTAERDHALEAIAQSLEAHQSEILEANQADCAAAAQEGIAPALLARLKMGETKLQATIAGVRQLQNLPDPVGSVDIKRELDSELILKRISCPLGVLGVIFEARPEALIQITSLAIKSGNGVILKGGKEAIHSCQAITAAITEALATTQVHPDSVQLLTTREEIRALLALDDCVDLIIPRGSNAFVRYVQDNTRIPVLGHADGICHLYIDQAADLSQAVEITTDSKTQYPAACNAIETLLVHQAIAPEFLPAVAKALSNVELRGDTKTCQIISINPATETDWQTEYSDLVLSIAVVDSLESALEHIQNYSSRHTEAIVTENEKTAQVFLDQVDAAGVFHNCSTRFADGFRYGFGAEVGISTQKMPPRGPVGLEGLVTYKYQLVGKGQVVATYTGSAAKSFQHRDML